MKKIIIIISCLLTAKLNAQFRFSISPSVNYGRTSIYNKEDVKGFKHKNGEVNRIHMLPAFMPSYGLSCGVSRSKLKTSLTDLSIGLNKMTFHQNYKDALDVQSTFNYLTTASTTLNYLSIPIHAKFRFGKSTKIIPTLTTGLNINLLKNYSDQYKSILTSKLDSNNVIEIRQSVINNRLELWNPVPSIIADLDSWYYNKVVFCTYFNFGLDYNLTSKFKINLGIDNLFSINDIENKKKITGRSNNAGQNFSILPYDAYIYKVFDRGQTTDERGITRLIRTGINFSIGYNF